MCHISPDKIVLDIGAGRGATACHLARKYGCKVTAIDASGGMIQACREGATSEMIQDRVEFRLARSHDRSMSTAPVTRMMFNFSVSLSFAEEA
jgi:cyclopropane fatty-acyl-phospholipid synthase-like methyltransferase